MKLSAGLPCSDAFRPSLDCRRIRERKIIFCVVQGRLEDDLLWSTREMDRILKEKGVNNAWFDYWGFDVDHDWPFWRRQLPYFVDKLLQ